MRSYKETHPWLDFSLDLRQLDSKAWIYLGEAASKIEHIAGVPLYPEESERLHAVYLAKGVLATTAIEGNTLTEDEVKKYLEGKLELPPSRQYLGQEIDNIVDACNRISEKIINGPSEPICPEEICTYNSFVLKDLPHDEDTSPGKLREHSVTVGRYRAIPPQDCEHLLNKFCQWLNEVKSSFPEGFERHYAITVAIAAHLYFVWIHPFGDGNGRTARLIEFRYLLEAGFPTPAAHLLSNFYNQTRSEYYRQLDKASRSQGDISNFVFYAVQGLVDQLREQLSFIRNWHINTTWQNYVFENFGGNLSDAQARRRRLVLDLSGIEEDSGWIRTSKIRNLTPRLARKYAGKTQKALTRDLNSVEEMGLIKRDIRKRWVKANKQVILAFLPARVADEPEKDQMK